MSKSEARSFFLFFFVFFFVFFKIKVGGDFSFDSWLITNEKSKSGK